MNEINNANKNLNDYKEVINTTFRDGVLNDAEYVRLKTISNEIDKDKLDNTTNVNDLKANAYLTASLKETLTSLKSTYDAAHKDLQDSMAAVISDKTITSSENSLINTKLSNYNTALSNINTHMQKCLNDISENQAIMKSKEAVDTIDIVEKNLIEDSAPTSPYYWRFTEAVKSTNNITPEQINGELPIENRDGRWKQWQTYNVDSYGSKAQKNLSSLEVDSDYTLSADVRKIDVASTGGAQIVLRFSGGADFVTKNIVRDIDIETELTTEWQRFHVTGRFSKEEIDGANLVRVLVTYAGSVGPQIGKISFRNIKLEKGNKPTDWTLAVEEIGGAIQDVNGLKSGSTKVNPNVLSEHGMTAISGGKIKTVEMELWQATFLRDDGYSPVVNGYIKNDRVISGTVPMFMTQSTQGLQHFYNDGSYWATNKSVLSTGGGRYDAAGRLDNYSFTHETRYFAIHGAVNVSEAGGRLYIKNSTDSIFESRTYTKLDKRKNSSNEVNFVIVINLGTPTGSKKNFYIYFAPSKSDALSDTARIRFTDMYITDFPPKVS